MLNIAILIINLMQGSRVVCNERIFDGLQFPLAIIFCSKKLYEFVARLLTLYSVPFASKSVNYSSHKESLKMREILFSVDFASKTPTNRLLLSLQRPTANRIIDRNGCKRYHMKQYLMGYKFRIIDQFGRKMCQKKLKYVSYQLL